MWISVWGLGAHAALPLITYVAWEETLWVGGKMPSFATFCAEVSLKAKSEQHIWQGVHVSQKSLGCGRNISETSLNKKGHVLGHVTRGFKIWSCFRPAWIWGSPGVNKNLCLFLYLSGLCFSQLILLTGKHAPCSSKDGPLAVLINNPNGRRMPFPQTHSKHPRVLCLTSFDSEPIPKFNPRDKGM